MCLSVNSVLDFHVIFSEYGNILMRKLFFLLFLFLFMVVVVVLVIFQDVIAANSTFQTCVLSLAKSKYHFAWEKPPFRIMIMHWKISFTSIFGNHYQSMKIIILLMEFKFLSFHKFTSFCVRRHTNEHRTNLMNSNERAHTFPQR